MEDYRQTPLDVLIKTHQARIIKVDSLRVGVQLETLKPEINAAFNLSSDVSEILMHGRKADEVAVLFALIGDEIIDAHNLIWLERYGVHNIVRDVTFGLCFP